MTQSSPARLSALDLDLLRIETQRRPMHWCFVIRLQPASQRVDITELRQRVAERAQQRDVFQLTVERNRLRAPAIGPDRCQPDPVQVRHLRVAGEAELRHQVAAMLSSFTGTNRLWDITLADDTDTDGQYLIVRLHHCLGDGPAASGFAFLIMDGNHDELAQFDRFLSSPRFEMFDVAPTALLRSFRHLGRSWLRGARHHRPSLGPASTTRLINYAELPAASVNQAARAHGATQMEFLLAAVAVQLGRLLEAPAPTVMRTMVPVTLDPSMRHTGNATAFAIVNLPLGAPTLAAALEDIGTQMRDIAAQRPDYALPTLTQNAGGPWLYKRLASIGIMHAVGPDLDVGLNPLHVTMESVFGAPVDAVIPFSPLVYTPVSLAALILGDKLTIGINSDAAAVGNLGETLAAHLPSQLTDMHPAQARTGADTTAPRV